VSSVGNMAVLLLLGRDRAGRGLQRSLAGGGHCPAHPAADEELAELPHLKQFQLVTQRSLGQIRQAAQIELVKPTTRQGAV
jgi:hypothetical protein